MNRHVWTALVLSLVAGCNETVTFKPSYPTLEITVVDPQNYVASDLTPMIDLGGVPVYQAKVAVFKLSNPSQNELEVSAITLSPPGTAPFSIDERQWDPDDEAFPKSEIAWRVLKPRSETTLRVVYSPVAQGQPDLVTVEVACNANTAVNGVLTATVKGTGLPPDGAQDIEIAYDTFAGPAASDCATSFDGDTPVVELDGNGNPVINICRVPAQNGIQMGNIGLNARGSIRVRLRNVAECRIFPGIDPCDSCALTIAQDPNRQNIGIGFKEGTNTAGQFAFVGSTATPVRIRQKSPECDAGGEVPLLLEFTAPNEEGSYSTVVVIESDDPDEPLIEVPVTAFARNAPIAIAQLRAFDPGNPSAPYTDPNNIQPLDRVWLDGRKSYDPQDITDPERISGWNWQIVEWPAGANPNDFAEDGQNTPLYNFWLPLAGHYVIKLTVTNTSGVMSGDTPESRVEFDSIPGDRMHIQLVWDDPSNDQDLHVVLASQDEHLCDSPYDCYYSNETPVWYSGFSNANPSLDIDDTNGLGPENINIDTPQPALYKVYVHYYSDYVSGTVSPTKNTVRIYINGVQRAEYRRTLSRVDHVWAVADINWLPDGTAVVTPHPSDTPGEAGAIATMVPGSCSSPWLFP